LILTATVHLENLLSKLVLVKKVYCSGHSQEPPQFLATPINSGTGKARDFKFCTHIYMVNQNKVHENF